MEVKLILLIFNDFIENPDFYTKVSAIENAQIDESITVILENNHGGAVHLGGMLINTIQKSEATITLTIDGTAASTAAFVWTWIHIAKFNGHYKNVKTAFKNNKANLIFHRPRNIDIKGERFIEQLSYSETNESFITYVDRFDKSFVYLLNKYPSAKVFSLDNPSTFLSAKNTYESYISNKDVVILLDAIAIA